MPLKRLSKEVQLVLTFISLFLLNYPYLLSGKYVSAMHLCKLFVVAVTGIALEKFCFFPADKNRTQRYVLSDQTAAWSDARSYCRQHYTDLATIQNSSDNQAIAHLAGSDIVWIGLYREKAWSDQSSLSFVHWKSGEPDDVEGNQKCVAAQLSDMGKWSVEDCRDALQFFCYNGKLTELCIIITFGLHTAL